MDSGVDVDEVNPLGGRHPVHYCKSLTCLRLLIEHKADVGSTRDDQTKALHGLDNLEMVTDCVTLQIQALLQAGLSPNQHHDKWGASKSGVTDCSLWQSTHNPQPCWPTCKLPKLMHNGQEMSLFCHQQMKAGLQDKVTAISMVRSAQLIEVVLLGFQAMQLLGKTRT